VLKLNAEFSMVLVTGEFMQALLAEGSFDVAAAFTDEGKHLLRGCREPFISTA
jgi:hypothetical protein